MTTELFISTFKAFLNADSQQAIYYLHSNIDEIIKHCGDMICKIYSKIFYMCIDSDTKVDIDVPKKLFKLIIKNSINGKKRSNFFYLNVFKLNIKLYKHCMKAKVD